MSLNRLIPPRELMANCGLQLSSGNKNKQINVSRPEIMNILLGCVGSGIVCLFVCGVAVSVHSQSPYIARIVSCLLGIADL
jgi:hypothetical protein